MSGATHGGKGSKQRQVNRQRFDENYDEIFKKKTKKPEVDETEQSLEDGIDEYFNGSDEEDQ